jgi:DNA modification methylase
MQPAQLDLFRAVAAAYTDAPGGQLSNQDLYARVSRDVGLDAADLERREPIGRTGQKHSKLKRAIRWQQQTLKQMGVVRRAGERGVWEIAEPLPSGLHAAPGASLLAFSTRLGMAIWGDCRGTFAGLDEPISLVVTSPPYPIAKARAYGGPGEAEYVDFICASLEPLVRCLVPGGSVCLNVSNDCFVRGLPARSLYQERLTLALAERLGLFKMDTLIWHNPSKPPGPVRFSSMTRQQLNVAWEPVLWLCNDPAACRADNRRVLEPHTQRHRNLVAAGGERREAVYGDGAYRLKPGSYSNVTPGRIPRNVLTRGHRCADTQRYRADATKLGLPVHGAMQPLSIPDFLIRFLSVEGDLVVDPFGGTAKTAMAAERLERRWIVVERVLDYLRGGAERFRGFEGFGFGPGMQTLPVAA